MNIERYEFGKRYFDYQDPEQRPIWTNVDDEVMGIDDRIYINNRATIWRWQEASHNDFAARIAWCVKSYDGANHPPLPKVDRTTNIIIHPGEEIEFDASGSTDPDGDSSSFYWFTFKEEGDFWGWIWQKPIQISDANNVKVSFGIGSRMQLAKPQNTHLILAVTDNATSAITRYKRIDINILPEL